MNYHHSLHSNPITLHATTRRTSGDFEYQELTIQLQAMKDQEVNSSQLTPAKRDELEGYIQKLLETQQQQSSSSTRPSSSHSASSILLFPLTRLADVLPQTKWRLVYTTEPLLNNKALPMKDVTIRLHFLDDSAVDYMLEFSNQPLGLQKLTAKSSYTVDSSSDNTGLVCIQYKYITTDVFGLKNFPLGLFGMFQGRTMNIPTAFFDGKLWIEKRMSNDVNNYNNDGGGAGTDYYNVYVRDDQQA